MRRLGIGARAGVLVLASCLLPVAAGAHGSAFLGGQPPPDVFKELATLFGPDAAFSARVDVVRESGVRPTLRQHLTYHLAPGKLRVDEDINETTGMPGDGARQKKLGIDLQTHIVQLDPPITYIIFSNIEAYAAYPDTPDVAVEAERSDLGEETVDGVPCLKHRIVLKLGGQSTEYLFWNRKDDPRIPVQLKDDTHEQVTATFHDVELRTPPAVLFEVPKGYARFDSVREVIAAKRPVKRAGAK